MVTKKPPKNGLFDSQQYPSNHCLIKHDWDIDKKKIGGFILLRESEEYFQNLIKLKFQFTVFFLTTVSTSKDLCFKGFKIIKDTCILSLYIYSLMIYKWTALKDGLNLTQWMRLPRRILEYIRLIVLYQMPYSNSFS